MLPTAPHSCPKGTALLLFLGRGRHVVLPDAQSPQQRLPCLLAADRPGRVVTPKTHEQRAAAEPAVVHGTVGRVQGHSGLADPRQSRHHHHTGARAGQNVPGTSPVDGDPGVGR